MSKKRRHHQEAFVDVDWIIVDFIEDGFPEEDIQLLSVKDTRYYRSAWEDAFIRPFLRNKRLPAHFTLHHCSACEEQKTHLSGYNWHVFSFDLTPHRTVETTFLLDFVIEEPHVLYMFEECDRPIVKLASRHVPLLVDRYSDFYLFPENCRWTYVNTHETHQVPPIGPFYSDAGEFRRRATG